MKRRYSLVLGVLVLLALVGVGGYFLVIKDSRPNEQSVLTKQVDYQDPETKTTVKYPETAKTQPTTESDKKDKIVLRLTESEGQPPILVTLRSESGLRVVASLTKATIIDIVMASSDKALPQRFKGFQKESSRRYEHNGRKAGEVIFTYDSPVHGERIKQRLVALVKDDDTVVYLAMQSKEADFGEQNQKIFDPMASSLAFN